jgi:cold shock CspA family protein
MRGKVKWYDPNKGFGFIAPITGGPDSFVHISALKAASLEGLNEGEEVEYELIVDHRGKKVVANLKVVVAGAPQLNEELTFDNDDELDEQDTSVSSKELIKEVSEWKLEAKSEDNDRYFFHVKEVSRIENGDKCYVIGRKGSGKTAISEYLGRLLNHDTSLKS